MKKVSFVLIGVFMILVFMIMPCQSVYAATSCYKVTPKITNAVEDYLSEYYIKKYPEMGLEFSYGSAKDKEVLSTLADTITAKCSTKKQKADAIAKWVARNIEYRSMMEDTYAYPIDVFYERQGNCLGYGLLISQLMRLEGIPAVMCTGERGDMVNVLTVEKAEDIGHGWVMAYFNSKWHLYDPLYGEFDTTDKSYISKWYFTKDMEGVSPYYKGMDTKIINDGYAIFCINGKFINYANGVPASQYYGNAAEGGKNYNGCVSFFTKNKYANENGIHDGFQYLNNPQRKDSMVNDECYTNGWISYSGTLYLPRPNGILTANTIRTYDNQSYFFAYDGSTLKLDGKASDYALVEGYIALAPKETITLLPTAAESELAAGKVLVWESLTPKIAQVDRDGKITAVSEGLATILVVSKDSADSDTHYLASFVQVSVSKNANRVPNYKEIRPLKDCKITLKTSSFVYNGKKKTPSVIITNDEGNRLVAGTDYTVSYKNNINAGKATVTIKGKGNYTGTITKKFTIKIKGTKLKTVTKGKKQFTVNWTKVPKSNITGYQIRYSKTKNFAKYTNVKVKKNTTVRKTIKVTKGGQSYWVKIRTYKTIGKKTYYSSWSEAKKIIPKK